MNHHIYNWVINENNWIRNKIRIAIIHLQLLEMLILTMEMLYQMLYLTIEMLYQMLYLTIEIRFSNIELLQHEFLNYIKFE